MKSMFRGNSEAKRLVMDVCIILCDQLSSSALRSYGNRYDQTTHINNLIQSGTSFSHAYTPCPLCQPARAAIWSSSYPHENGVTSNVPDQGFPEFPQAIPTLGDIFSQSGYRCVHFGKEHDYGALRGFTKYENKQVSVASPEEGLPLDYESFFDENTTSQVEAFFSNPPENPLLTVVDLQNPHNICSYIGESENTTPLPHIKDLPDLPDNFHTPDMKNRPAFIQYLCCAHRRQSQTVHWQDQDFQYYLYAYHAYLEMVDKQVGRVLASLEKSGKLDNTLVVFTSDHGEGMAAHRLVTKYGAFYNETNEVPLSFTGCGVPQGYQVQAITSLLDVAPTLADLCNLKIPKEWRGKSLKSSLQQQKADSTWYAVGEWFDEFSGYQVPGRMYVDSDYKYSVYRDKDVSEELYDRVVDPLEQKNLATQNEYTKVLKKYREELQEHCTRTDDPFYQLTHSYSDEYRQHEPGFRNHIGPNAVVSYFQEKRSNGL